VSFAWRRSFILTAVLVVATAVWGTVTGHRVGAESTPGGSPAALVLPFNESWRVSIAITLLGAGIFLAIPIAWLKRSRRRTVQSDLFIGTIGLVGAGAITWGARLADFTMFYLYFAGIAVFATPIAAIAARTLWAHLRTTAHMRLAAALLIISVVQLDLGAWNTLLRLEAFSPHADAPISVKLLDVIRKLPRDARLAYSCGPFEESGFGVPALLGIDAHADRRVVPMCFEAETLSSLNGAPLSRLVENLFFKYAPQRALYPNVSATPSSEAVAAFMKAHGIDYIFVDGRHPNKLVANALPVAAFGRTQILRVP